MSKTLILFKCDSSFAKEHNIKNVLAPKYNNDIEVVNKINGDIKANVYQPRNLKFHCKLFGIAGNIVNDEFFQMMLDQWEDIQKVFNIKLNLTAEIIQATRMKYNDDGYSLIYICKACFLEWERDPVSGNLQVSSIAFENLDNILFTDFYQNCLELWSYILGISRFVLENELDR